MPLAEPLATWWRRRPETAAFLVGRRRLDYGRLASRAAAVAAGLRELPALRRDVPLEIPERHRLLAIQVGNAPAFAELLAGATAGDGACAVLDPRWPPERTREVLRRLRPDAVALDTATAPPETTAAAGEHGATVLATGGPIPEGAVDYENWLAAHDDADPARELRPGHPHSTFLIGFTSGTSGTPKAFHRSRESWRAGLAHSPTVLALAPDDHTLAPGPLSHGLGLYALVEALHEGTTFATLPRFDAEETHAALATGRVSRLVVVPTMLRALLHTAGERPTPSPAVRAVVSSGATLDPATLRRARALLPRAGVHEYYGASELSFVTVAHTPPDADPGDPDAVGTPFPGVTVQVRDPDGASVPPGTPGTIWVRGPLACAGYLWGDDGHAFATDGAWATVGDQGRLDRNGGLRLAGRAGGMVVTGGNNVHPGEVEDALRRLDGVEEAVVLGRPDDYLGNALVAVVSGPGAGELTRSGVLRACGAWLERHKVPHRIYTLTQWPLTRSGKIARAEIEEWIADGDSRLTRLPDT